MSYILLTALLSIDILNTLNKDINLGSIALLPPPGGKVLPTKLVSINLIRSLLSLV